MKHRFYSTLVFASMFAAGAAPTLHAKKNEKSEPCSNASLHGTFGFYSFGTVLPNTPRVNIGRETYDGKGNFVTSLVYNQGGSVTRVSNNPGTYTVNPDCTGTGHAMLGPLIVTLPFVIVDDGNEIDFMPVANPPVFALTGVRKRLFADGERACTNAVLNGSYGFYSVGTIVPAGTPRLAVGRESYDGKGNFSNTFAVNTGGVLTQNNNSGLYSINSDCFGQVIGPVGPLVVTVDFIVVDDANEIYFIVSSNDHSLVVWGVRRKQSSDD
jgi:hypothetical protein